MVKMQKIIIWFIIVICFIIAPSWSDAKEIDTLKVLISANIAPLEFSKFNTPQGIFVDYMKLWSETTNIPVEYIISHSNQESIDLIAKKAFHVTSMGLNSDVGERFIYSNEIFKLKQNFYYTNLATPPKDLKNFNERVAVMKGDIDLQYIKKHYPHLKTIEYINRKALLEDALNNKISYFIMHEVYVLNFFYKKNTTNQFKTVSTFLPELSMTIGLLKGFDSLMPILNKGIEKITLSEQSKILKYWYNHQWWLGITEEEVEFLSNIREITIGVDGNWEPIEYIEKNGRYSGLVADYYDLITEKLGISYKIFTNDEGWYATMDDVLSGRGNAISVISQQSKYVDKFYITDPIYSELSYIFALSDKHKKKQFTFKDLENSKVGFIASDIALPNYITSLVDRCQIDTNIIIPVYLKTIDEGIDKLINREIDYYIDDYSVVNHKCEEKGITNIDFIKRIPSPNTFHIAFVKNQEGEILCNLFNKVIKDLTSQDKTTIYSNWVSMDQQKISTQKAEIKEISDYLQRQSIYIYVLLLLVILLLVGFIIIKVIRDNKERIASKLYAEELKVAKEKAEEANRIKTTFIADMSHEIRTPLNAIVGFSNLIANENIAPEDRKIFGKTIATNNTQLLNLVENILYLSEIEAGLFVVEKSEIDIISICNEVIEVHKHLINPTIEISFVQNTVLPISVISDREKLLQVFNCLLSNASKFTNKGSIKIGYDVIKDNGKYIRFFVADTGIGIEKDKEQIIFERFKKIDVFCQGTGLGLSISHAIVEELGGKIWLTSEIGAGSTFFFTIPYVPANSILDTLQSSALITETKTEDTNKTISPRKTILLASDDKEEVKLLASSLDRMFDIIKAMNGQQAVSFAESLDIDLILMNIEMSLMDGITATKEIKKKNIKAPIILMVESNNKHIETDEEACGASDFIMKPISKSKLLKIINTYIGDK